MKTYPGLFLIFLCIIIIFSAGCTSQKASPVTTPEPTPLPAAAGIPPPLTPEPPAIITLEPTIPPTQETDPTNVSEIKFLQYSDGDFSVDYPSTWTVTNSTYFPYHCESILDDSRNDYHVCFENETKSIGPFYYWENDKYKKPYRIVTFTSADGKLKFASFTIDFLETMAGNYMLKPNMDWTKAQFEARYPGMLSTGYITNYKYFQSGNALTSTFDVNLPDDSKYYPKAYTEKAIVTVHHAVTFAFMTDNENFKKYKSLKERMVSSIKIDDKW